VPSLYTKIAYWSWLAVLLVWLPGQFVSKRDVRVPNLALQIPTSMFIVVCFVILFSARLAGSGPQITPRNTVFGLTGLVLDLAGVAFAIWARLMLGRNWSGFLMTVKENHQLVQRGPYAFVRHPIYAGLALAAFGLALTIGTLVAYAAVVAGLIAFVIRTNVEDKLMSQQFGEAHAAYRGRTKRLVPFVW
jgi:protein-S-isoprenylcysteine O-methyltransferase Ste14